MGENAAQEGDDERDLEEFAHILDDFEKDDLFNDE